MDDALRVGRTRSRRAADRPLATGCDLLSADAADRELLVLTALLHPPRIAKGTEDADR